MKRLILVIFMMVTVSACATESKRKIAADVQEGAPVVDSPASTVAESAANDNTCDLPANLKDMPNEVFIKHKAMLISYNPRTRVPNYVFHEIYRENLERSCFKRPGPGSGPFQEDGQLKALIKGFGANLPIVDEQAYRGTKMDRGHLAPNSDFAYDPQAQVESFVMTNMMPQQPDVNRVTWQKLEDRIRSFGCGMGHLKVYTGVIFTGNTYGKREVRHRLRSCAAVPEFYYKALLSYKNGRFYGIGFVYSQDDRKLKNLSKAEAKRDISNERVVSIAEIEKMAGVSLFGEFSAELQKDFKNQKNISDWSEDKCYRRLCRQHGGNEDSED